MIDEGLPQVIYRLVTNRPDVGNSEVELTNRFLRGQSHQTNVLVIVVERTLNKSTAIRPFRSCDAAQVGASRRSGRTLNLPGKRSLAQGRPARTPRYVLERAAITHFCLARTSAAMTVLHDAGGA